LFSDDPTRKLMRQMMGAIADYEKSMIVLKLRGAPARKKARTGRCEGRKPMGTIRGRNASWSECRRSETRVQGSTESPALDAKAFSHRWRTPAGTGSCGIAS